ncbi:exopolysaccharide biosynthesis polyprenyl glycosylphosphotransferase [Oryzihumus sp.]
MAICIALAALPAIELVALAVHLDSAGPILFRQNRIGARGEPFEMLKFRTMVTDAEDRIAEIDDGHETNAVLFKKRNDPRVTRVGKILRRYSLDELPQLFNVLRGDMSLVGPRPPLPQEVEKYEPDAVRRLRVQPGLTGLWQVSGRSDLSWEESLRLDLWYVDNWSLVLDVQILIRTLRAVVRGAGAY